MRDRRSGPAALMVMGRALNLGLGLAMIPMLIHYLKSDGFAAFALLLSCSAFFSVLDVGVPTAFRKEAARALHGGQGANLGPHISAGIVAVATVYLTLAPIVIPEASRLAAWLRLPIDGVISREGLVVLVFVGVALRSVFRLGFDLLYAAREFRLVGALATGQAFASNAAATVAAAVTRDLGVAVACFWGAQVTVSLLGAWIAGRRLVIGSLRRPAPGSAGNLLRFGLKVQLLEWAQAVNFQFDKFVVLGTVGLHAVSVYEVANRSVLALRSLPAAGMDTFLPSAVADASDVRALRAWYLDTTRLAAYAVAVFVLAPMAVAPVFLTAWVGDIGYAGRWAFVALAAGSAANLIVFPSGTLVQALDHPEIQAKAALVSLGVNVPLSLGLVHVWGVDGAAAGTALAMVASAGLLMRGAHRAAGFSLGATITAVGRAVGPIWAATLLFGVATRLTAMPTLAARGHGARLEMIGIALGLYVACLALMIGAKTATVAFRAPGRWRLAALRTAAAEALDDLVPAH